MTIAFVHRLSPWILVAVLIALALLTMAVVTLYQTGMVHALGSALHGAPFMAPVCGSSFGPC
jgi:hypothetical protein